MPSNYHERSHDVRPCVVCRGKGFVVRMTHIGGRERPYLCGRCFGTGSVAVDKERSEE